MGLHFFERKKRRIKKRIKRQEKNDIFDLT